MVHGTVAYLAAERHAVPRRLEVSATYSTDRISARDRCSVAAKEPPGTTEDETGRR